MKSEFVDLNLPSGTLWAKCNLGVEKETDFGLFYQWGDVQGHRPDEGHHFSWDTYKHGTNWNRITKYNEKDGKLSIDSEDDPVYIATDGKMMSPTKEQFEELRDHTNHEWTEINGVKGMKFVNMNDDTKYIFIPAAGGCYGSSHDGVGSWGYVWSSSRYSGAPNYAWGMYFDSGNVYMYSFSRCYGYIVRGVTQQNI